MRKLLLAMIAIFATIGVNAQNLQELGTAAFITPYHLEITDQKTTVILFPSAIQSVDRGTAFVLAEKVKGSENVLKVKAQNKFLPESNLSVVTTDGQLYSFTVSYAAKPAYQAIDLKRQQTGKKSDVVLTTATVNESYLQQQAIRVFSARPFMNKDDRHHRMSVTLQGIYSSGDLMFFRFSLANQSKIGYKVGITRFFISDKKRAKRTAIQEADITPVYTSPDMGAELSGHHERQFVVAFNRFTIADNKRFTIQLTEKDGDRNLNLAVSGKELLKAVTVNK